MTASPAGRGPLRRSRSARWGASLALLGLFAAGAAAVAGSWSQPFAGAWAGQGRFLGNDAQHQLSVAPALDGHFVRFNVRYRWTAADGREASFTGEALYPAEATSALRGAWFDSEGHQYSTSAYLENPRAMIVHWGDATTRGRTEYRVLPSGELQVADSFWQNGHWQAFSSARLSRASGDG